MTLEHQSPARAGRREWIGLAVIALPCLLYAMDLTVLNLAIPSTSAELKPSAAQMLWIVDIYGFFVAGSLITMGTLGDRIAVEDQLAAHEQAAVILEDVAPDADGLALVVLPGKVLAGLFSVEGFNCIIW